jgi:secreted Zn-dependent insulinase-like peptidase
VPGLAKLLGSVVPSTPAPDLPGVRVLQVAAGEALQYAVDIPHDDAVVAWYLQAEGKDWSDRAATALTAQIMKSGFFQQLRTEQQLGYVVSAFNWPQVGVPGLVLLVQSPVVDAAEIVVRMEAFMDGVVPDLDQAQFERHREALMSEILRPDKNLGERAEFYWLSIARRELEFDSRLALATALEEISLQDWVAYYQRVFMDQRHSLQVVAPGRLGKLPPVDGARFDTATALKRGRPVYQLP